jgi:hypothetical protein
LSDGIDKERMAELAREIEEREAQRIEVQGSRFKENNCKDRPSAGAQEEDKMTGPKTGTDRLPAREIPDVIASRWIWRARSAELRSLLMSRGKKTEAELVGKGIEDLRTMAQPLVTRSRSLPRKNREKKPPNPAPAKKPPQVERPDPPGDQEGKSNGRGLHVHCMACGFRMEISAEGIRALQKGGAG